MPYVLIFEYRDLIGSYVSTHSQQTLAFDGEKAHDSRMIFYVVSPYSPPALLHVDAPLPKSWTLQSTSVFHRHSCYIINVYYTLCLISLLKCTFPNFDNKRKVVV